MTGALYGFDYCTVRAPLCLCHSHETTRLSVRQPSLIVSELFSSFNRFCQSVFSTRIQSWLSSSASELGAHSTIQEGEMHDSMYECFFDHKGASKNALGFYTKGVK